MYRKYVKLRDEKGVTDYRVSVDTGITKSTFSDWKNCLYTPKVDKLQKLANYFNVPLSYFLEDTKEAVQKVGQKDAVEGV